MTIWQQFREMLRMIPGYVHDGILHFLKTGSWS